MKSLKANIHTPLILLIINALKALPFNLTPSKAHNRFVGNTCYSSL